jgi:predicted unusual protein kinase regulating ubiquinone biosynthesis (AarF/ABC1/UbiB family)
MTTGERRDLVMGLIAELVQLFIAAACSDDADTSLPAAHRAIAQQLYDHGMRMGGIYVKAMQFCAAGPVLDVYRDKFRLASDRATTAAASAERRAELAAGIEGLVFVGEAPLSQGSVAQVWEARLDGRRCCVKLLNDGIREEYRGDLGVLREAGAAVDIYPNAKGAAVTLAAIATKLTATVESETNLTVEAQNHARIREVHHDASQGIVVPEVLRASEDAMVTEYLDEHETVASMLRRGAECVPLECVERIFQVFARMLLVHRFVQFDTHPGNFMWNAERKELALIDHGQCAVVPPEVFDGFVQFLQSCDAGKCERYESAAEHQQRLVGVTGGTPASFRATFLGGEEGETNGNVFSVVGGIDAEFIPILLACQYLSSLGRLCGQRLLLLETLKAEAMRAPKGNGVVGGQLAVDG